MKRLMDIGSSREERGRVRRKDTTREETARGQAGALEGEDERARDRENRRPWITQKQSREVGERRQRIAAVRSGDSRGGERAARRKLEKGAPARSPRSRDASCSDEPHKARPR